MNDQRAHAHFNAGVMLYDAKPPDYAGALVEFEAALREKPSWIILENIALCDKALRRYPAALDALDEAKKRAGSDLNADERAKIDAAMSELRPLIAEIHVSVTRERGEVPSILTLTVDGTKREIANGDAIVRVGVGEHAVDVIAPTLSDFAQHYIVTVAGTERAEIAVALPPIEDTEDSKILPGDALEDDAPGSPPRKLRKYRVEMGTALSYTNLRLSSVLGEGPGGKNRSLYGASFLLRGTRAVSHNFAVGIVTELGTFNTFNYSNPQIANAGAVTSVDTFSIGAVLSFATRGPLELVSDLSASFLYESAVAALGSASYTADGTNGSFALDLGARYEWDRVTVSGLGFGELHSVGSVVDTSGNKAFLDSVGWSVGLRAIVGFRL